MRALAHHLVRLLGLGEAEPGSPGRSDAALGLFVVAAAAVLAGLTVLLGGFHWGREMTVSARFSDATGLTDGAPVVVAGVDVGRVTGLAVKDAKAVVTMSVSPNADLRADMTAAIRSKTLLGERVIELLPGSPAAPPLRAGEVIARTLPSTEPDNLMAGLAPFLAKVNPDDVAALARVVGQVARSGQISRAVSALARLDGVLADGAPKIATALAGVDDALSRTPTLMTHADRVLTHSDRLALALDGALATSSPHLAAQAELVLDRLPTTLDRLDLLADRLSTLSDKAGPALDKASGLLNEPTVHRLLRDDGIRVHFGPF